MDARSKNWADDALMSMFEANERIGLEQVETQGIWEVMGPRVVGRLGKDLAQMPNALMAADAIDVMVSQARERGMSKAAKALLEELKKPLEEKSKTGADDSKEWALLLPLLDAI